MQELVSKLNSLNCVVRELTERIEHADDMNRRLKSARNSSSTIKGMIILIIILVSGILLFSVLGGLLFGRWDIALIFGIVLILCIGGGVLLYKKCVKNNILEIESLNKIVEAETANINNLVKKNISILNMIPRDYWYPLATDYILKVVRDRRANSINEALNMYDQQLHRWNMENMNATILAQSQAQTAYLKQINIYNQISAVTDVARMLSK